ncbi:bifunctional sugar phosphate isomerase/epimerase/4-hydroxyphenylpyruvate dioxygenase family protein [Angustibacter luteus]|uniref:3-dehydroshikimate dehydratase n=1 Tax=Angustibacter luteus TaxID=658456 RepID=A0ABW1JHI4_9ACTN
MRRSTATVSLSGDLISKMKACAEVGFDGIELFEPDLVVAEESPAEVRALADRLGLRLELYQPFRDFEGVAEADLEASLRRAAAKFALMNSLGIDTLLLCSNVATAVTDDRATAVRQLSRLADLAEKFDVRVAYEALAWGRYISDYRDAWEVVQAVDHPRLGICLDSFHILSRGHDPAAIEAIPAEKIFFVQLADAPAMSLDVLSWSRHFRLFPGEGAFDLPAFLAHVLRGGYDGPLSLEVFNDVFRRTDTVRTAAHSLRSLIWLEDATYGLLAGDVAQSRVSHLSAASEPTGVNFVEIRAESTDPVESTLLQLGFRFRGHHRSKPVRLWTQGAARVILNEQGSRDRAPWIAALGLDVPDPTRAVERARELMAPEVFRRNQAGEQPLEAVTAPDGSEIFLCPAPKDATPAWLVEFENGSEPTDDIELVTRVDHVNLVHPRSSFDEATLFYSGLLALDITTSTEVASPIGLVQSRVMSSRQNGVRLVLNVGPDAGGLAAGVLPQHVAFATTDVAALARQARERGLDPLPIPTNYYDDLAARFGLADEVLEGLRSLDLLYDRDEKGEFLHFYTRTIGSVFFEAVERRLSYDGFGAPNAPVRLAAQHRSTVAGRLR